MKLYIGCKRESGEGTTPYKVGFSKAAVKEAMRQSQRHPENWKEDEIGDLVDGCDYITIRETVIPDSIIMSLLEGKGRRRVFDVK